LHSQRFGDGKNKGENIGEEKMVTYQIEATIEKIVQDEKTKQYIVLLKGAGEYLFEKPNEKKKEEKDKEYWSILEAGKGSKLVSLQEKFQIGILPNELGMIHLLGYAFAEKKKLKFTLKYESKKYTITAVSNAST